MGKSRKKLSRSGRDMHAAIHAVLDILWEQPGDLRLNRCPEVSLYSIFHRSGWRDSRVHNFHSCQMPMAVQLSAEVGLSALRWVEADLSALQLVEVGL